MIAVKQAEMPKPFVPVTITITTPEDLALVRALFGACSRSITNEFNAKDVQEVFNELDDLDKSSPRVALNGLESYTE